MGRSFDSVPLCLFPLHQFNIIVLNYLLGTWHSLRHWRGFVTVLGFRHNLKLVGPQAQDCKNRPGLIIGQCLSRCVGQTTFNRLSGGAGWKRRFVGPAPPTEPETLG